MYVCLYLYLGRNGNFCTVLELAAMMQFVFVPVCIWTGGDTFARCGWDGVGRQAVMTCSVQCDGMQQCAVCSLQCAVFSVQCAVFAVFSVQCAVCSMQL